MAACRFRPALRNLSKRLAQLFRAAHDDASVQCEQHGSKHLKIVPTASQADAILFRLPAYAPQREALSSFLDGHCHPNVELIARLYEGHVFDHVASRVEALWTHKRLTSGAEIGHAIKAECSGSLPHEAAADKIPAIVDMQYSIWLNVALRGLLGMAIRS